MVAAYGVYAASSILANMTQISSLNRVYYASYCFCSAVQVNLNNFKYHQAGRYLTSLNTAIATICAMISLVVDLETITYIKLLIAMYTLMLFGTVCFIVFFRRYRESVYYPPIACYLQFRQLLYVAFDITKTSILLNHPYDPYTMVTLDWITAFAILFQINVAEESGESRRPARRRQVPESVVVMEPQGIQRAAGPSEPSKPS